MAITLELMQAIITLFANSIGFTFTWMQGMIIINYPYSLSMLDLEIGFALTCEAVSFIQDLR